MCTLDKLKQILVAQLEIDESLVTPAASLTEDLGADSLDLLELTLAFESEFNVKISEEDEEHLETVQDVLDLLEKEGVV